MADDYNSLSWLDNLLPTGPFNPALGLTMAQNPEAFAAAAAARGIPPPDKSMLSGDLNTGMTAPNPNFGSLLNPTVDSGVPASASANQPPEMNFNRTVNWVPNPTNPLVPNSVPTTSITRDSSTPTLPPQVAPMAPTPGVMPLAQPPVTPAATPTTLPPIAPTTQTTAPPPKPDTAAQRLLDTLRGVHMPPSPAVQTIHSPAAPKPSGNVKSGQLLALLEAISPQISQHAQTLPVSLGQALGGR